MQAFHCESRRRDDNSKNIFIGCFIWYAFVLVQLFKIYNTSRLLGYFYRRIARYPSWLKKKNWAPPQRLCLFKFFGGPKSSLDWKKRWLIIQQIFQLRHLCFVWRATRENHFSFFSRREGGVRGNGVCTLVYIMLMMVGIVSNILQKELNQFKIKYKRNELIVFLKLH